ncbi:MAG: CvpA family protein [Clostridiales bacterium]|nr:CvpA family protein [Clostridiales bacterium]
MNIIDYGIMAFFALSVVAGFYQGFVKTVLGIASFFGAYLFALLSYPSLARWVEGTGKVIPVIIYYSESSDMLGPVENVRLLVSEATAQKLYEILSQVRLPHPLGHLLTQNVLEKAFAPEGIERLGDYLSMTIAHMAVNILAFVALFVVAQAIMSLALYLCDYVFRFPVLRQLDGVMGGLLGFIRGGLFLFVLFTLVPVLLAFLPFEELQIMLGESQLATFFYKGNFMIDMFSGFIG